ncbi:hypothetical protein MUN84_10175 [Hymenobacter sp. 5516J-16]|uniref:Uncharacterized protein n=1 Tax=Hymenobacter sublimis TaxID=2933777 RepID=A0ABY4J7M1_9BACT|nr:MULTISPECIES: hypothetical protein [Hymenobacter]UOQ78856.1 hypothetical protein MUN84_10175 [Hymenobacter sp. 5516J-16]UPL48817.1 hypothetical protein MWH26_16720 [Hymenobacter sublimis]
MKVNLSNLSVVLAAQRQATQPKATRKKTTTSAEPTLHSVAPTTLKK